MLNKKCESLYILLDYTDSFISGTNHEGMNNHGEARENHSQVLCFHSNWLRSWRKMFWANHSPGLTIAHAYMYVRIIHN